MCLMLITLVVLQDVAAYIKKEFDKKHNPTWQVDERALYKLSRPLSTQFSPNMNITSISLPGMSS